MTESFAERIKTLQQKKGVDDGTTAEYIGIPLKIYRQTVEGKRPFLYEDLKLLETYFGIRSGKLIDEYMAQGKVNGDASKEKKRTPRDYNETPIPDDLPPEEQEERGEDIQDFIETAFDPSETNPPKEKRSKRSRKKITLVPERKEKETIPWDQELTKDSISIPEYNSSDGKSIREAIGIILKECRKKRGLTLKEIREKARISTTTWLQYEHGRYFPTVYTPETLGDIFNANTEIFAPFYEAVEKMPTLVSTRMAMKTMFSLIESYIYNKGDVNTTAQQFNFDRTMIPKLFEEIFREEPALEYIIHDSLPDTNRVKRKGTFENANRRRLIETIQQQYTPTITGPEKKILATSIGYKSWYSLERAIETRKLTIEEMLKMKLPPKPFKEYSCKWPREET